MRVRTFQPHWYMVSVAVLRMGYVCRSRFHSTRRKIRHRVTWFLAKTSHPTSRWDVAVTNGHCSRTALPLTRPESNTGTCSVRTFSSLSQTFFPANSPDLNQVNLSSGVLFSRRSTSINTLRWQNKDNVIKAWQLEQSHGAVVANSLFHHLFIYWSCYSPDGNRYSPKLIQINYGVMFRMKWLRFLCQIW